MLPILVDEIVLVDDASRDGTVELARKLGLRVFVFDSEIIAQGVIHGLRIREIPIETRYFQEASQVEFWRSSVYGLSILRMLVKFKLHKKGLVRYRMFS